MYTAVWNRYPHGVEGEAMESKQREFATPEKAIAFLQSRVNAIKGINWAGGYVEDENLNLVYSILDNGEIEDNRNASAEENADQEQVEALKNKYAHIVAQYDDKKEREFFSSYVLGTIRAIISESDYGNDKKAKCVEEVLQLVDNLTREV